MRAGDLRHDVLVEQRSTSTDALGGQVNAWSTLATLPAGITPLQGRELLSAQTISTEITHRLTFRHDSIFADPRAVAAYRITYGSRQFAVHGMRNEGERDRQVTVYASEGLVNG